MKHYKDYTSFLIGTASWQHGSQRTLSNSQWTASDPIDAVSQLFCSSSQLGWLLDTLLQPGCCQYTESTRLRCCSGGRVGFGSRDRHSWRWVLSTCSGGSRNWSERGSWMLSSGKFLSIRIGFYYPFQLYFTASFYYLSIIKYRLCGYIIQLVLSGNYVSLSASPTAFLPPI